MLISRNLQLDVVETDAVVIPHYEFMALTQEILKLPTEVTNADPSFDTDLSIKSRRIYFLQILVCLLSPYQ